MNIALDTNTYRAFMDAATATVGLVRRADAVVMPVPVLAELRYGFARGTRGRKNEAVLVDFLDSNRVRVVCCDEDTTHVYAQLKVQLAKQGTPIPINDVWIAALVLQHSLHLHTLDRDFDRLPQLLRI
jgi:tRNA(fMet)-specific endonuclease VapC